MLEVNVQIRIPEEEISWTFVRSGGPGGQNVNKVASKAVLRWGLVDSPSVPEAVKSRLRTLQRRRMTTEGELLLNSQRFRDQERNKEDCLEKLRAMLLEAATVPKARKAKKPTRASKERRLAAKRRRSAAKSARRLPSDD